MTLLSRRLSSVDAFRAVTMLLMIFVNDLILVDDVPRWIEHAAKGEDRLGFADTIFPAFLFIVGLSIPLAMSHAKAKGQSKKEIVFHIFQRSFALLVMGVFQVNYEEYTTAPALLSKWWWMLLMTICLFLIWLVYPSGWPKGRKWLFRGLGIAGLVALAVVYKGGTPEHPMGMRTHWYGILGLIGWVYLVCALAYVYIGDRMPALTIVFLIFLGMSIAWCGGWLPKIDPGPKFWWEDSIGIAGFTMAGTLTMVYYRRATGTSKALQILLRLLILAPVLLVAGFLLRPLGGISKLDVTPSWILICTAISIACFALLAYIVDLRGRERWYDLIRPAGTITLTCYLLPYLHFALLHIVGLRLPQALRTGWVGVGKSFVFAFLIVLLAGVLQRKKVRLSV